MIQILPEAIVDRIAAGEVVERPAAVVKELVENALDAGATRISVFLEGGGQKLIKVVDNGEGIAAKELRSAFLRHATSKLRTIEDLSHIASLGFRGEALSSIGAVSQARITSRPRDELEGAMVQNEGGVLSGPRPAGCPPGTSVEARFIFYNVPARLKFMKKESTELSHCVDGLIRFSLAYPEVAFTLMHNGKKVVEAEKEVTELERIANFFGKAMADRLIKISRETLGIEIRGHLGRPDLGRRDLRRSLLFLNGRHVRDKIVHAAIRKAYGEVMPGKFHPVYFLNLSMPPDWADVNVHPTKEEIRFLDGARIFSAVFKVVSETLAKEERAVMMETGTAAPQVREREQQPLRVAEPSTVFPQAVSPREREPAAEPLFVQEKPASLISGKVLMVHKTFAVFATEEGLSIVDFHALHERVLYEQLRQEYETGGIKLQNLLMPMNLDLDPTQAARRDEIRGDLGALGIRAEPAGSKSIRITALPALLRKADPLDLAREVINHLSGGGGMEEVYRDLLSRMACRAAVKAGQTLEEEEVRALLVSGGDIAYSGRCPHGRPTTVTFSLKELEELFKRRGF